MNLKEILEKRFLEACGEVTTENEYTSDLLLTKDEFIDRVNREDNGQELLDLLEMGESNVCERMGLCHGYIEGGVVYFKVPEWNHLISHLKLVNSV